MNPSKTAAWCFGLLVIVLADEQLQGSEGRSKPIVYNYVSGKAELAEKDSLKKTYAAKFQIVEVNDRRSFSLAKWTEYAAPEWDGKPAYGTIAVFAILTADGRVIEPFVVRSSNARLNEPVLKMLKQWRGKPSRWNGSPVASVMFQEFVSEKKPPPAWLRDFPTAVAFDAKGVKHSVRDYVEDPWLTYASKKVTPVYNHTLGEGGGLYRVTIDLKTGSVSQVTIVQSTGTKILDTRAIEALRQWEWKPGSWRQADVPFIFGSIPYSSAGWNSSPPLRSVAPMGSVTR